MSVGVVLFHGLTGSPTEMRSVATYLGARGYVVETPLLPGHGKETADLLATGADDWLAGASKALEDMRSKCDEVFLVGLCASSVLAALVAADNPDVAGLILLSSHYGKIHPAMPKTRYLMPFIYPFPALRKKLYWTEGPPYGIKDKRMQELITAALNESKTEKGGDHGTFRTYVESFYQCEVLVKRLKARAKQVICPTLFLHSLEDTWFPAENSLRLAEDIGAEDKVVNLFMGCDHVMTVDLKKNYVCEQIELFIRERARSRIGQETPLQARA